MVALRYVFNQKRLLTAPLLGTLPIVFVAPDGEGLPQQAPPRRTNAAPSQCQTASAPSSTTSRAGWLDTLVAEGETRAHYRGSWLSWPQLLDGAFRKSLRHEHSSRAASALSPLGGEHRMRRLISVSCLVIVPFMLAAATATASAANVGLTLEGPVVVQNPSTGDMLRLAGAGTFDPTAGTITARGSFTRVLSDGSVFSRGTWVATGFTNFIAFGGSNDGLQGGILDLTVTLVPDGGTPITGLVMEILCMINAPPGVEEGVTLDGFTELISGTTAFHSE
jgi:hypothetical protein